MATFSDSVTAVLLQQPFFGQLLMRFKHEETTSIPTACVTVDTIKVNPEYWAKLTDDQGVAGVTHEVAHAVFQHLDDLAMYAETGIGPDGKAFDAMRLNKAQDYVINDMIQLNKIGELHPNWLHAPAYTHTMIPADVYCMLPEDKSGKGSSPKGKGGQSAQDMHDASGVADANVKPAITPTDILQAAKTAEAMGAMPVGLDRVIGSLQKPAHSPWAMLRKMVQSALGGNDASTWKRLQRRLITRGIGAPGRTAYGCNLVGVVVDTSGSIGDEILSLFAGHMGAILTDARPKLIKVYWTDAEVHRIDDVRSGGELRTMMQKPVPGGGGTDMQEGIDAAAANGCEVIVCLTDLYTPFGAAPRQPVIWASTTPRQAPYGRTIHIA